MGRKILKSFKHFLAEDEGEKKKDDVPDFYVHYAVLSAMIENSKEDLTDRSLVPDVINWFKINKPEMIYHGSGYRGTYLSQEKLVDFFTHGKMVLNLMPYYSFSKDPGIARTFLDERSPNRNGALIKKENLVGIMSSSAAEYLQKLIFEDLREKAEQAKFDTTANRSNVGDLAEKFYDNSGNNYKTFEENLYPSFNPKHYDNEKEVIVTAPVFVDKSEVLKVVYNKNGRPYEIIDGVKKNFKYVIKAMSPAEHYSDIMSRIKSLEKEGYHFVMVEPPKSSYVGEKGIGYWTDENSILNLSFSKFVPGSNKEFSYNKVMLSILNDGQAEWRGKKVWK